MGQLCVTYKSTTKLTCSVPNAVGICVPSYFLAARNCPDGESLQTYEYNSFEGVVVNAKFTSGSCGQLSYNTYTICFDEALIAEGQTLTCNDILGIFELGCLGTWTKDLVGNEIQLNTNEDGTLTLVTQHGCEYTFTPGGDDMVIDTLPYLNINLDSTGASVKAAAGKLYNYLVFNESLVTLYVKLYDTVAAPNPLIHIPFKVLPVPPPMSGANLAAYAPINFNNGLWVRGVTGVADTDVTSPGANELIVNFDYV